MKHYIFLVTITLIFAHFTFSQTTYPIRCIQIGDSVLGTVTDCNVVSDPLPFRWQTTIKLKKNLKWAGNDDIYYIYSNPDDTITGGCDLASPVPGTYSKNDNITIAQTCNSFDPPLVKGANLIVMVFYTHHDSFDDVLMYNFPIPGYINEGDNETPQLLSKEERVKIIEKIKAGTVKPQNIRAE